MATKTKKPKGERVKVVYNWDGAIYDQPPHRKRAKILAQADLQALQARGYIVIVERFD